MSQPEASNKAAGAGQRRRKRASTSLFAYGEPMVWVTGGALALALLMIIGLLMLVMYQGMITFWPKPIAQVTLKDGSVLMGQFTEGERYVLSETQIDGLTEVEKTAALEQAGEVGGTVTRRLLRRGNKELYGDQWQWIPEFKVTEYAYPADAIMMETDTVSRLVGFIDHVTIKGEKKTGTHQELLDLFLEFHGENRSRKSKIRSINKNSIGPQNRYMKDADLSRNYVVAKTERKERIEAQRLQRIYSEMNQQLVVNVIIADGEVRAAKPEVADDLMVKVSNQIAGIGEGNDPDVSALSGLISPELEAGITDTIAAVTTNIRAIQALTPQLDAAYRNFHKTFWTARGKILVYSAKKDLLEQENQEFVIAMRTVDESPLTEELIFANVVRMVTQPKEMGVGSKVGVYLDRWAEFLFGDPRKANSEGGVFPAIVGTVVMTLAMTIIVVPFGVLAALYIREYAKAGFLISTIRIAINNLAGVPSIVFGVFGLGFFCYIVGSNMDALFYPQYVEANTPKFGGGGVLWASFTLALLTLPVVIVATEEALAAVPNSMREGSYGCGASKWQTIQRIVLPRAMPGIMTGMILAMARGAGEVAPLMMVGAAKLAPDLPIDRADWSGSIGFLWTGPIHLDRSFMHLGFHIYDVGFQSQDAKAAEPMVFTTTLLLIVIVALLNIVAIFIRNRLRKRFSAGQF